MSIPGEQAEVAALLRRLAGRDPIETHISAVYVGTDTVWKLKKAVALGFLDFSTPAAREHFLRREWEINHPAAPALYRDVVPVTRAADGTLALGGAGEAVDWVLRMAPVPAGNFLDAVAARGGLDGALLDAIADAAFALHAALPPVTGIDPVAALDRVLSGNVAAAHAAGLPAARVEALDAAARGWLERLAPHLAARAAAGHVRRCHGDLHLGNLCLLEGRVTPFDALEFDEDLATIDTGYDLAFLLMDLDHRVGRAAANRVLNRSIARSGDAGMVAALPLWLSIRAMIRAHVLARTQGPAAGLPYLDRAEAMLAPPPPRLVAVGGLQGTGKSRLARALAPSLGAAPGALVLRSDEIRKRRAGLAPEERLPPAAYTPEASRAVFEELAALAAAALRGGHAVIADAAFLRPEERAAIEAARGEAPFTGLWLEAPVEVLRARVAARRGDASDAGVAVLEAAAARDHGPLAWQRLDAAGDPLPGALAALGLNAGAPC
ncbi:bifunctional aminoglycoside phosphotransferase/ATP-binding protein [Paracraurococcus lichenis]|uniref:AAA family ATPase n=1 Tax=Paracraurococcus lichenis TaxID=3064888 RepID=A0ABT9E1S7_9PROT|nr:bifunctional aminoglycoside phosphotransferase/ATP-binding protein [Paracraurococcus sp. LOR1-02]MDO9710117.1 AAA family ATPase [Paracraurococcus sp. LOR1-02]